MPAEEVTARHRFKRVFILLASGMGALIVGAPLAGGSSPNPSPPSITGSTPQAPANDNNPVLRGTAQAGFAVKVYAGSCPVGIVVATTLADGAGNFAVPVTVGDNTSTTFYATARGVNPPKTSPCSEPFTYVEDSLPPPKPWVESGPPTPTAATLAHFVFADAEPDVSFLCQLDGAVFAPCPRSQDFTVGDGSHSLLLKAVDAAGNASGASSPYTWVVDTVNPLVSLADRPPLLTNRTSANFSFTADKPGSAFECRLDGGDFVGCTSPRLYSGVRDGLHTFAVRATSLGKVGVPTQYTWTVDTVAPQTALSSTPPALSSSASATFTFASNEPASSFACSLDGGGVTTCASPKTYTNLPDKTHTFRVQAVDRAGNADATAAAFTWTISGGGGTADTVAPHDVRGLRRSVGYGHLRLRWTKPRDADFDHVGVYVSATPKSAPRQLVYKGRGQTYANHRFRNGLYYRYLIVSYDRAGNASRGRPTTIRPSVLLRSPRDGHVVGAPPLLRWAPVPKATFYNVQLYHMGKKILSAWPSRSRQALAHRWTYQGRQLALGKGTYVWLVWPGFGPRSRSHYGQLLGQGSFRIRAGGRR
jgi:hypothetical protein